MKSSIGSPNSQNSLGGSNAFRRRVKQQHILAAIRFLLLIGGLTPCFARATPAQSQTSPNQDEPVTRNQILATARQYAEHKWSANPRHVFHGKDKNGNQVDTPDKDYRVGGFVVGQENVGIPYKWGGFDSIEEFDKGLAANRIAGHLPKQGSSPASPQAVGVDCSGLVSICWNLPRKQSTRSLGNLCYVLDSYDELMSGDLINSFDGHAVIFESFVDTEKTKVAVYEAGGTKVKKSVYSVSRLKKRNFKPLRYKPLDDRWVKQTLAHASFKAPDIQQGRFESKGKTSQALGEINHPLLTTNPGDWATYQTGWGAQTQYSISKLDSDSITIRSRLLRNGKSQWSERTLPVKDPLLKSIVDFAGFNQDFGELTLKSETIEVGQFQLNEQSFTAHRMKLEIETSLLSRGTTYPVSLTIDCLLSDDVPLAGIIKSRYELVLWDQGDVRRRSIKQIRLTEFFQE